MEALRRIGVSNSVGIDLVPYPPLVLKGDFHDQPFQKKIINIHHKYEMIKKNNLEILKLFKYIKFLYLI